MRQPVMYICIHEELEKEEEEADDDKSMKHSPL
jgi:hypothetical protein